MKHCIKCNVQLHDDIQVCPYCGEKQPKLKNVKLVRNCKKCGFELTREMDFCPHCGTVPEETEEEVAVGADKNPAPVKCKRCESSKVQLVSEYVELEEKEPCILFGFLNVMGFFLIIPGIFLLMAAMEDCAKSSIPFLTAPFGIAGLILFASAIIDWVFVSTAKLFQPYKHETRTRAICMDCGKTWVVDLASNKSAEKIQ